MRLIIPILAALAFGAAQAQDATPVQALARAEAHFLDFLDADSAIGIIDSGLVTEYEGRDRATWEAERRAHYDQLTAALKTLDQTTLSPADSAARAAIRVTLADHADPSAATAGDPAAPKCADVSRSDLDYARLRAALVSCFRELGNNLAFEGRVIDRGTALQLLHEIEEPERRMLLFDAFNPLWDALNAGNTPDSPYRRMIRMAAEVAAREGSQIDAAAKAIGVTTPQLEQWLVQMLEAWRDANPKRMVEPWDYRYRIGKANRALARVLAADRLLPLNKRFYADLGADLDELQVLYDLEERKDKSPLAYSDFQKRGRATGAGWQRPRARIVGRYPEGGLFSINELVHENGHAVHVSAIETRPAFMDWPDTLFTEAFADVPSWSVYERAWQKKYLGAAVSQKDSLRALHGLTALDVAWSLFELRMLRDPAQDPNRLWTDITREYLRILPHPEIPWWAMRVQLASRPGYMVNYGLGAVLAAEIRHKTAEVIGPFDTGNANWYGWLSERLLKYGSERDTRSLMQDFLGRPPSPAAVLAEIRRVNQGRFAKRCQAPFVKCLNGALHIFGGTDMRNLITAAALAASAAASASDGAPDTGNQFPAAGAYYEYFVYLTPGELPEVAYAEQSCSGSLIAPKVLMTAAHCTAYNYTIDIGITGYYDLAWVTFDLRATGNDFRCFLVEQGVAYTEFMTADYGCDPAARSVPFPTFLPAAIAGRNDGVPIAHGLTHPGYLREGLRHDGRATPVNWNLLRQPDVGAVILVDPVTGIDPLPLRAVGELDTIEGIVGTPVVSVGYGLNWTKLYGEKPTTGIGPQTDLGGGNEVKRIARLGPIKNLFENSLVPRQDVKKGDDVVCFGDSGSPLFLERGGVVEPAIAAVLSGATNWCQGSMDPYYRIDQREAQEFLQCVIANQDDVAAACRNCSAEADLGLCE